MTARLVSDLPLHELDNGTFLNQLVGPLGGDDDNAWICGFNEPPTPDSPWTGHLVRPGSATILSINFNTYYSTALFPLGARGRTLENAISPFVVVIDDAGGTVLPPTYTLRTSPDRLQIGYALAARCAPDELTSLMRWLSAQGRINGDPRGNNAVRYVRLPRGRNWKHNPTFETVLEQFNPERRYPLAEIQRAVGFDPAVSVPRIVRPAAGEVILEGGRDDFLTREAGRMRRIGMEPDAMAAALAVVNQQRCQPPVEDRDIQRIARSVGRYAPAAASVPPRDVDPDTGEVTGDAVPGDSFGELQRKCQTPASGDRAIANFHNAILAVEYVAARRKVTLYWSRFFRRGFVAKGRRKRDFENPDYLSMLHRVQTLGWGFEKAKKDDVFSAVEHVMHLNARDELVGYLDALPPAGDPVDGKDLFDNLAEHGLVAKEGFADYAAAVFRCMFVGGVARQYVPGIRMNLMPVLEGAQQIGKSWAIATLAPLGAYNDPVGTKFDSKDFMIGLQGRVFIEIPELSALQKSEIEAAKAMISKTNDRFRSPYDRRDEDHPRRCIMVGTTNRTDPYLLDDTGNARFLPVPLAAVDVAWCTEKRDALWSLAVKLYREDFKFWIPPTRAGELQAARTALTMWVDLLRRAMADGREYYDRAFDIIRTEHFPVGWVGTADLLTKWLGLTAAQINSGTQRQLAAAMKELGYVRALGPHPTNLAGWKRPLVPPGPNASSAAADASSATADGNSEPESR